MTGYSIGLDVLSRAVVERPIRAAVEAGRAVIPGIPMDVVALLSMLDSVGNAFLASEEADAPILLGAGEDSASFLDRGSITLLPVARPAEGEGLSLRGDRLGGRYVCVSDDGTIIADVEAEAVATAMGGPYLNNEESPSCSLSLALLDDRERCLTVFERGEDEEAEVEKEEELVAPASLLLSW